MKHIYLSFLIAAAGFPVKAQWNITADMSDSRTEHMAVALGADKVLVAGGWDGTNNLSSAEVYDHTTDTWTATTNNMSSAHTTAAAVKLADGKVLMIAGWDGSTNTTVCDLFDPATDTWTATGSVSYGRSYHTATLLNDGRVLITGGYTGSVNTPACEIYDPVAGTWSQTDSLVTGRSYHTATLLSDGKVLVVGGYNPAAGFQLSSAEIFDPVTETWSAAATMNDPRAWHSASLLSDGRVMVAGGEFFTGGTPFAYEGLSSVEAYDPVADSWSGLNDMPGGLSYNQQFTLNSNRVIVIAGLASTDYGSGFSSAPGVTYLYNVTANTWSNAPMNIDARIEFGATQMSGDRVMVTGGSDQTAEIFDNFTSVNEDVMLQETVQVFPNPSNGMVNIAVADGRMDKIQLFDLSGKMVYAKQNVNASVLQLDLESLSAGIYNLKIQTGKGIAVKKIALEK